MNEIYIVRWPKDISAIYMHGSTLKYSQNNPVYYANEVLSPGQIICSWRSISDYLSSGISPSLPMLQAEEDYTLDLKFESDNDLPIQIQIDFFDTYGEKIHSERSTEYNFQFNVPKGMACYEIHLVNLRHHWIKFDYLSLQHVNKKIAIEKEFNRHYSWIHVYPAKHTPKQKVRFIINCGLKNILPVSIRDDVDYEQVFVYSDGQKIEELIEKIIYEFQVKRNYQLTFEEGTGFYTFPQEVIHKLEINIIRTVKRGK